MKDWIILQSEPALDQSSYVHACLYITILLFLVFSLLFLLASLASRAPTAADPARSIGGGWGAGAGARRRSASPGGRCEEQIINVLRKCWNCSGIINLCLL